MTAWFVFVCVIHGALMIIDEVVFHYRRRIPKWERIGHPLDTLTVLACLLLPALDLRKEEWTGVYLFMAVFSCLFVTKDEWIHKEHCLVGEHWIHSILFILHPVLLGLAYQNWNLNPLVLSLSFVSVGCFFIYQLIFWNFYAKTDQPVFTV